VAVQADLGGMAARGGLGRTPAGTAKLPGAGHQPNVGRLCEGSWISRNQPRPDL